MLELRLRWESRGDSYANALAETIHGLYKAEVIHRRAWPSVKQVELARLTWVHWDNHQRVLGSDWVAITRSSRRGG